MKPAQVKSNGIDFQALAQAHGYVKARQLLAQATIQSQQNKMKRALQSLCVAVFIKGVQDKERPLKRYSKSKLYVILCRK